MEEAPFFVDFHHFLSIFTIFCRFSQFTHFCRDLHFVAIYAIFPQIFFGQNGHLRNKSPFLDVCSMVQHSETLKARCLNMVNFMVDPSYMSAFMDRKNLYEHRTDGGRKQSSECPLDVQVMRKINKILTNFL